MLAILQAISDPTRFAILQLVKYRELAAGDIAAQFPTLSRPAISQHLRVLKEKGLIRLRRQGRKRLYQVRPEGFSELRTFLESFWEPRLTTLKALAEAEERHLT